jgi:hypothetical protein
MRKPIGSWASLTASVIAAATFTSACNNQGGYATGAEEMPQASVEKGQSDVPGPIAEVLSLCGYDVTCKSFADGEVNISGNRKVDAFFGAAANLELQAGMLEASVATDLRNIVGILGLELAANASIEDLSAAISGHITGGFGGMIEGNVTLDYKEPQCSVTAQATLEASAKCDVEASGGSAMVECKGECVADANAMLDCGADVDLQCTGTAPSFACEGSCSGTCNLTAGGSCSGECKGTCTVEAEANCDGEFTASTEEGAAEGSGTCKARAGAKCDGTCTGSCELTAAAECTGECKGECKYTAPEGGCTGGAKASCEGSADVSVMCQGECKGEVTPPMVEADCQATAKAEAEFSAECTPPSVGLSYQLSASAQAMFEGDAEAQVAFEARLQAFATAYGELIAKGAKIELVANAGLGLAEAGAGAVGGIIGDLAGDGDADIQARFDGFCAVGELEVALQAVTAAGDSLEASVSGVAAVTTAIGG